MITITNDAGFLVSLGCQARVAGLYRQGTLYMVSLG